jgi:hypothetical protein
MGAADGLHTAGNDGRLTVMITNPLLEEIWAVKDRLAAEAGNDIHVFCGQLRAWESSHLPKGRVLRTLGEIRARFARQVAPETLALREEPPAGGNS